MSSVERTDTFPAISAKTAPMIAFIGSIITLVFLAALHIASPEFDPSWRVVSEYALGRFPWLLSAMFLCWAVSSWALAAALRPFARTRIAISGLVLLLLSGAGEALAAFFDVSWPTMHGVAAMIGIPTLPIAALLISYGLDRAPGPAPGRRAMRLTAHLTWISFLVMGAAMAVFFSTYTSAGGDPNAGPPNSLPDGTIALNGWANRLLIVSYCAWLAASARRIMKLPVPA
jgi:hypothetical protein